MSTTAEDIEAVSLEAKILRARSRPRLQPTYRISALKTPVRSRAGGSEVKSVPYGALDTLGGELAHRREAWVFIISRGGRGHGA